MPPPVESPWPTTCPRCGRESGLNMVAGPYQGPKLSSGSGWLWGILYQCPTCQGFCLRSLASQGPDGSGIITPIERLPFGTAKPLLGLPPEVELDRDEAWRAFHGGLNKGAALLARSSLESAVRTLNAKGDDLKKKIANLADSGTITKDLAAWADEVRITGNEAAHEMGPVSEDDAKEGLFFLDSFLEAVFSVPARHRERKVQREAKATAQE